MDTVTNTDSPKVFILTYREETCMEEPLCFSSYEPAYDLMKRQYEATLENYDPDSYDADDTYINDDYAVIAGNVAWLEWNIWEVVVDAPIKEASQ